jgi:threonine dehydrogenase-like Zn-dependent dehydrogenase
MIALEFVRSVPRYVAARAVSARAPGLVAGALAPLKLGHHAEPALPGPDWVRVRPALAGICGSDLAMLTGHGSFYFSPIISTPFVPGHEIAGTLEDGSRVVVEPVLHCATRRVSPPCAACARGETNCCERLGYGHLARGLQTGYCADTGGGWSQSLVAHASQIHGVPDTLTDEDAVLVEPLACAVHAALRASIAPDDTVLVAGAGTIGLCTIAAVRHLTPAGRIIAAAKHPRQRREASRLGADDVVEPNAALRAVRSATRSLTLTPERGEPWLSGGADVSLECSGRMPALDLCLRATRPRGRVVLVGLPSAGRLDLAPVWHRELGLAGAYAYGTELTPSGPRRTFDIAIELAAEVGIGSLVSAAYPLARFREAVDHALDAGRLDAIKVVFDAR